jgi:hypothetical protein
MSSYGTLAASKAYHADRGNTAWAAADDPDLTIALLRGSEYVDARYRGAFSGAKTGERDQVREWPRTGATDASGYTIATDAEPIEVEYATYEAALRELATPGSLLPDVTPSAQVKRKRIEGIIDTEYVAPSGPASARPVIAVIDAIMAPLVGGGVSALVGSSVRS